MRDQDFYRWEIKFKNVDTHERDELVEIIGSFIVGRPVIVRSHKKQKGRKFPTGIITMADVYKLPESTIVFPVETFLVINLDTTTGSHGHYEGFRLCFGLPTIIHLHGGILTLKGPVNKEPQDTIYIADWAMYKRYVIKGDLCFP